MKKILFLVIAGLLLFSGAGFIYFLGETEEGLQTSIALAKHIAHGKLEIAHSKGKLFSEFSLQDISFKDSHTNVTIKSLDIAWDLQTLLKKKLIIKHFILGETHVTLPQNDSSTLQLKDLAFLGYIRADHILIKNIVIEKNDIHTQINGNLEKTWNINWKTVIPNLSTVLANSTGTLTQSGSITGQKSMPIINFLLTGRNLIIDNHQVNRFNAQLKMAFVEKENSPLSFTTEGNIAIPKLGITLEKINLNGTISNNELHYQGTFQSGEGVAQAQGLIQLMPYISLNLVGDHLQLIHSPEYKIQISPDVKLEFKNKNLSLTGKITIPNAEITPKDFSNTISLPQEIIYTEKSEGDTELPFTTTLQGQLILGEKISVAYKDLEAKLRGHLQINKNSDELMTATGELYTTEGAYSSYGKELTLQEGRLIYTGGTILNPGLNIKAARKITSTSINTNQQNSGSSHTLTIGLHITGTAEKPAISLFSLPADLSQADILSYLLFDRPQSDTHGRESEALLGVLSELTPHGGKIAKAKKQLQEKLGLNELGMETTEILNPNAHTSSTATSLVVGKQLTENFNVNYRVGIFNPISILNMRYQLSKRFSIQSETSTIDNGADLVYKIERD